MLRQVADALQEYNNYGFVALRDDDEYEAKEIAEYVLSMLKDLKCRHATFEDRLSHSFIIYDQDDVSICGWLWETNEDTIRLLQTKYDGTELFEFEGCSIVDCTVNETTARDVNPYEYYGLSYMKYGVDQLLARANRNRERAITLVSNLVIALTDIELEWNMDGKYELFEKDYPFDESLTDLLAKARDWEDALKNKR